MRNFSKNLIRLLSVTLFVFSHSCSDFNLSRAIPFTTDPTSNILYSQISSLFNRNTNFKLYQIQILRCRIRYVICRDPSVTTNIRTVRAISRSNYSLRNGNDAKWHTVCNITISIIKTQSWFTTWWNSFNHTHPSCKVFNTSAGPCVDTSHGTFLAGIEKIKEFYLGLKATQITNAENTSFLANGNNWTASFSASKPYAQALALNAIKIPGYSEPLFPIPVEIFNNLHASSIISNTTQIVLEDWKSAPLEIFCVSLDEPVIITVLTKIHELVNILAAPSFYHPGYLGHTGFHFSSTTPVVDLLCTGTPRAQSTFPILTINIGTVSPETLVSGSILANNFNSFADGVMVYDSNWTIRGGCVLLIVTVNDTSSPSTLNGTSRKDALLAAVNLVRTRCSQQPIITNLTTGGPWILYRTTKPWDMSFENPTHFPVPANITSNIISWLSEVFGGEHAFDELKNINEAILADSTGKILQEFSEQVKNNILFSLGTNNTRSFIMNFVPSQ